MSLSFRFTLFLSCTSLILLTLFSLLVYRQSEKRAFAFARHSLSGLLEHEWEHLDLPTHSGSNKHGTPHFRDVYLRMWKSGILLFDSFPPGSGEEFPFRGMQARNKLFKSVPKSHNGHDYELQGYFDLTSTHAYLRSLRNILLMGCLLALVLIVPLSYFSTHLFLRPFRVLARKTSELSIEKLDFRFRVPKQRDEYAYIARNFNLLLDRLQKSFEQVRRFAMNASHEIRTPLAVIIGQGEIALRRPRSSEEYRSALEKSLESAKKLREIVNRLLFLAELENLQREKLEKTVSLNQVVEASSRALKVAYQDKGKTLTIALPSEDIAVGGAREVYDIILSNLIENALKYSRTQATVRFSLEANQVKLQIEDDGPGIPQELREIAFEPLNRLRKENGSARGHGLGLSIVRTCVESLRASLALSDSPLGGLRVSLSIPRATQT